MNEDTTTYMDYNRLYDDNDTFIAHFSIVSNIKTHIIIDKLRETKLHITNIFNFD